MHSIYLDLLQTCIASTPQALFSSPPCRQTPRNLELQRHVRFAAAAVNHTTGQKNLKNQKKNKETLDEQC